MKIGNGQSGRFAALAIIGASVGAMAWVGWERLFRFGHRRPVTIEYETLPRSPGELKKHYARYYRSDGARVESPSYNEGEGSSFPDIRTIILPARRQRVAVDSSRNLIAINTLSASESEIELRPAPFWNNAQSCRLGVMYYFPGALDISCERATSRYLGYSVWRARADIPAGPEKLRLDLILAPDLDWRWVRLVLTKGNGGLAGNVHATRIKLGEPSAPLFEVPKSAKIVSEKEVFGGIKRQSAPDKDQAAHRH